MSSPIFFSFLLLGLAGAAVALDKVPEKDRFRFINEGEYVDAIAEYDATYRAVSVVGSPFQLTFYNTTPNAYKLAIRMGTPRSGSIRRWVWEANRSRPVRENATVSFGADGNLVLTDADGTVVWSTGTANKGVVGIQILHSGNMVLYDKKGGTAKLVSRKSESDGSPGIYSLVVQSEEPILYVDASPKPLVYFNNSVVRATFGSGSKVPGTFTCKSEDNVTYELSFGYTLVVTKYDSNLSFLRLTPDGDLIVYTYDDRVEFNAWEKTFSLFSPDQFFFSSSACYKPSKCLPLGICDGEQCVACPTAKGTTGWSPRCGTRCGPKYNPSYTKVTGVEHFLTQYSDGEGRLSLGECRRRCNVDCNCLGILYYEETSQCWLAPILRTLNKVNEPKHVAYIKPY
ncbi:unnamed protein product [Spirodela intermedia]|uniref:Bulb-type lectin domain-containing protein n=1 Tax=Spirodela intermedia TaxID=51605 RepID=A0A7I8ILS7_SPIIN|nr:unnamed protein product [Spirodela intermedia]CAA6657921.1 unnamed protein product [Spirodela intermedia]